MNVAELVKSFEAEGETSEVLTTPATSRDDIERPLIDELSSRFETVLLDQSASTFPYIARSFYLPRRTSHDFHRSQAFAQKFL
jgi:hypothetical protein